MHPLQWIYLSPAAARSLPAPKEPVLLDAFWGISCGHTLFLMAATKRMRMS